MTPCTSESLVYMYNHKLIGNLNHYKVEPNNYIVKEVIEMPSCTVGSSVPTIQGHAKCGHTSDWLDGHIDRFLLDAPLVER